jgi:hypothetical protein
VGNSRRKLLVAVLLAVGVLVWAAWWSLAPGKVGVNWYGFWQIREGMTEGEVRAILGRPPPLLDRVRAWLAQW